MTLAVGDRVPSLQLEDLDGTTVSLERWEGRALILVFLRHPG